MVMYVCMWCRFGGTFKRAKAYRAKPINSIVYPVYGGMEDWAYAAGWDTGGGLVESVLSVEL
jgi:hypothetical protein